ncbi:UDP-glycosyltransferase [Gregarina niphandrodes]|uniref:UDP-glycosyltransferase n=1 Tax=Gregarina niphandrodes TaxID=110365 RepID=A0A023B0P8_GRENI|nr:UDP-glycosyltransferase [Gregarina niphandrodes]EZG45594.1 UDP-glycosyltransferase [Gregarina niphandrodes]|eukprot:XP_011132470.1 UDP-glycosyltransferase [Gregarina niphandrodes]
MKAICTAIDKTPNYVLWSVRSPHKGVEGFSERGFPTSFEGKRARIVNWVNQPLVLQHRALGAFMSHCGWNSTIEACTLSGKPVICCPMGAEQFVNSLLLTTQMKNAVAVRGIDQEVLDSQDIVSKVNEAMTSSDLKTRAQEIKGLCNDCAKNTNEGAWKVLFDSLATTSS